MNANSSAQSAKPVPTIGSWITAATKLLQTTAALTPNSGLSPQLDTQLLAGHVLEMSKTDLLLHDEQPLQPAQLEQLAVLLNRRASCEPMAFILGSQEFYGLTFKVTPDTLIPRPETEILVEAALNHAHNLTSKPDVNSLCILDIGTGSGAIPISLANELQNMATSIDAVDISADALAVAKANTTTLLGNQSSIAFYEGSLTIPLPANATYDIICANLPYVPSKASLNAPATFEPELALLADNNGLALYEALSEQLIRRQSLLAENGILLIEHEPDQANQLATLFSKNNALTAEPLSAFITKLKKGTR